MGSEIGAVEEGDCLCLLVFHGFVYQSRPSPAESDRTDIDRDVATSTDRRTGSNLPDLHIRPLLPKTMRQLPTL